MLYHELVVVCEWWGFASFELSDGLYYSGGQSAFACTTMLLTAWLPDVASQ